MSVKSKTTKHFHEVHSHDINGAWVVKILKDGSQLTIEDGNDDSIYIDVDRKELEAIRDMITKIIGPKTKKQ